jgi:hypothetical protein
VRVQGVGLALASSGGPVGPVDLDDDLAVGAQPARKPSAVAAGAFHADAVNGAQRARPGKQRGVAGGGGGDRPGVEQPAGLVERGGDVGVGVVSTPRVTSTAGSGRVGRATVSSLLAGSVARTSQTTDSTAMRPVGQALIRSLRRTDGAEDTRPARPTDPIQRHMAGGSTSQAGGAGTSIIILAVDPG